MTLVIRKIEPDDLDKLIELCAEHAAYEQTIFTKDGQQQRLKQVLFTEAPRLFIWVVAEHNQDLQGYLAATIEYSTWAANSFVHMDCLYLKDSLRGAGIGRRLLNTLILFAEKHHCKEIQWQTPPDNQLGIGFYQHIGAEGLMKARFTSTPEHDLWHEFRVHHGE